ncbi:MFS transporter [Streptomyces sp. NPDC007896]|uniref:MFS transporter n=1 Tax=Streptomyces sp. NPDC007896 TaxID=3364784 RepID=UPI0036EFCBD0
MLQALYGPAVPGLRAQYGLSPSAAGLGLSLHFTGGVAGVLAFNAIHSRISNRALLSASYALMATGGAGFALAPNWPLALTAAFLGGLGCRTGWRRPHRWWGCSPIWARGCCGAGASATTPGSTADNGWRRGACHDESGARTCDRSGPRPASRGDRVALGATDAGVPAVRGAGVRAEVPRPQVVPVAEVVVLLVTVTVYVARSPMPTVVVPDLVTDRSTPRGRRRGTGTAEVAGHFAVLVVAAERDDPAVRPPGELVRQRPPGAPDGAAAPG